MSYEILVALNITDEVQYQKYRDNITSILHSYGGYFSCDFKVSEVLISLSEEHINRIFIINFPNLIQKDLFFSNEEYLLIKSKYFTSSVKSTIIIAEYEKYNNI